MADLDLVVLGIAPNGLSKDPLSFLILKMCAVIDGGVGMKPIRTDHAQADDAGPGVMHADKPIFQAGLLIAGISCRVSAWTRSQRRLDGLNQIFQRTGLFKVGEDIVLAGDAGRLGTPMAGVHDDLHLGLDFFDLFQRLNAVHPGHFLVQDDHFRILVANDLDRIFPAARVQDGKVATPSCWAKAMRNRSSSSMSRMFEFLSLRLRPLNPIFSSYL